MKATPADLLAEHFIRESGIGAIAIGNERPATIAAVECSTLSSTKTAVLCCARPNDAEAIADGARRQLPDGATAADAAVAVRAIAAAREIALTPHNAVLARARAAVAHVERTLTAMKAKGDLKGINRDFKAAREADPNLRYRDYFHARKLSMLTVLAQGIRARS
ncbi:hypothetical protein [Nitrobacter sp.]|uniref:hypothetical protein n=1 Tax=Nitrobacter sp. TaxID=29420 RepID=UPI0029CAB2DE|nr:hypothetical protein [Nitrobacter sp.]